MRAHRVLVSGTVPTSWQAAGNITAAVVALSLGVPEGRVAELTFASTPAQSNNAVSSPASGGLRQLQAELERRLQTAGATPPNPGASELMMSFVLTSANGAAGPATEDVYGILAQSALAWLVSPVVNRAPGSCAFATSQTGF